MSTITHPYRFRNPRLAVAARGELRKLATLKTRPRKLASLGGDQEGQFEQSFASLAFAYLKDKAPKLLDYMIGFQLVDRNDDNTKAVGIFGFKVGEEWVYAPVFFLNGDLKGHELLYLKSQDQFVPMAENWVNYLLNRQPHMLGEGTTQTSSQLGVRQPNYNSFNFPPNKTASWHTLDVPPELGAYVEGVLPLLGVAAAKAPSFMAKHAGLDARLNLKNWLSEHVDNVKLAMSLFERYPVLQKAADEFYGKELLKEALLAIREKVLTQVDDPILGGRKTATKKPRLDVLGLPVKQAVGPDVKIKFDEDVLTTQNTGDLSDEEQEELLRDGMLVEDNRTGEEVSVAYNVQQPLSLQNPTETGLFDVLVKGGKFKRCLVVIGPISARGNQDFATIVDVDTKAWKNVHPTQIFVRECEDKESYHEWLKKLPTAESLEDRGHYLVISPSGKASTPFEVEDKQKGDDDVWRAYFREYCDTDRASYLAPKGYSYPKPDLDNYDFGSPRVSLNRRKGSKLVASARTLYVPTDSYKLTLKNPPKKKEIADEILGCGCHSSYEREPDPPPIAPGNLVDLQMEILQKTARLKIVNDGAEVWINGDKPRTVKNAFATLVLRHGLRADAAREMLKTAARKSGAIFRIKYADPYAAMMGPGAPAMPDPTYGMDPMGSATQAMYPQEEFLPVPDMSAQNTDPSIYDPTMQPDNGAMQVAQQAAQTGQKEVFDTAMIGSMLKAVREDSLVDRYLGDLLKALDRLGRILFLFYWHSEEFQDRYGKADMPELEDSLRNAFEAVGDITLYLKQKQIEPFAGSEHGEPEIDETARN